MRDEYAEFGNRFAVTVIVIVGILILIGKIF